MLSCVTDDLVTITLGWFRYVSMIFATVLSSSKGLAESPYEDGLVPKHFSTMLIQCSLLISMPNWSSEKLLFMRKGFSVF